MPVSKSDAGWRRFQERTDGGRLARRARMDHRVRSAAKPRSVQSVSQLGGNELEPEIPSEFEAVTYCGDCDGPCTCE